MIRFGAVFLCLLVLSSCMGYAYAATSERFAFHGVFRVDKYAPGSTPGIDKPASITVSENLLLTQGATEILKLVTGASSTHANSVNAMLGVGNSASTPIANQTGLQGGTKVWMAMDGGYPTTPSGGSVQFRSTYGPSDANFTWGEVGMNTPAGLFDRTTNSGNGFGNKVAGATWVLTLTISLQ